MPIIYYSSGALVEPTPEIDQPSSKLLKNYFIERRDKKIRLVVDGCVLDSGLFIIRDLYIRNAEVRKTIHEHIRNSNHANYLQFVIAFIEQGGTLKIHSWRSIFAEKICTYKDYGILRYITCSTSLSPATELLIRQFLPSVKKLENCDCESKVSFAKELPFKRMFFVKPKGFSTIQAKFNTVKHTFDKQYFDCQKCGKRGEIIFEYQNVISIHAVYPFQIDRKLIDKTLNIDGEIYDLFCTLGFKANHAFAVCYNRNDNVWQRYDDEKSDNTFIRNKFKWTPAYLFYVKRA